MASYNWNITTSWVSYGPTGAAKLNVENSTGVVAEYATATSAPSAGFVGGRLRDGDAAMPVDLKAGETIYLRVRPGQAATSTVIFGQDVN